MGSEDLHGGTPTDPIPTPGQQFKPTSQTSSESGESDQGAPLPPLSPEPIQIGGGQSSAGEADRIKVAVFGAPGEPPSIPGSGSALEHDTHFDAGSWPAVTDEQVRPVSEAVPDGLDNPAVPYVARDEPEPALLAAPELEPVAGPTADGLRQDAKTNRQAAESAGITGNQDAVEALGYMARRADNQADEVEGEVGSDQPNGVPQTDEISDGAGEEANPEATLHDQLVKLIKNKLDSANISEDIRSKLSSLVKAELITDEEIVSVEMNTLSDFSGIGSIQLEFSKRNLALFLYFDQDGQGITSMISGKADGLSAEGLLKGIDTSLQNATFEFTMHI